MTVADGVPSDRPADPDAPADLTKRSWWHAIRRAVRGFMADQCTDLAAALTYYSVLAVIPASIALLSLVGLVGQRERTVDTLLSMLEDVGGSSVADAVRPSIESVAASPGAGIALLLGLAGALWSASGYVTAFGRAMNTIYRKDEGRPVWKLRPLMLLLTLFLTVLAAVALVSLILSGPVARAVGEEIGLASEAVLVWQIAKWPVLLGLVVVIVALLYYATPNVRRPRLRWVSVGAVCAIVTWALASAAFGLYVANFSSYNKTYGAMAGVIVFLLWLWLTNLALLFGAEVDAELERARELQAGLPAEEDIQLPLRDDTAVTKAQRKEQKEIAKSRDLRDTRGGPSSSD